MINFLAQPATVLMPKVKPWVLYLDILELEFNYYYGVPSVKTMYQ